MTEWEQVPAWKLRKNDTVKRSAHAGSYTLTTEPHETDTVIGRRVHLTSAEVHMQSSPDAIWWRKVVE